MAAAGHSGYETSLALADLEAHDSLPHGQGRERRFLCPFPVCRDKPRDRAHQSLSVNAETGWYWCYRCTAKGRLAERWEARGPAGGSHGRRDPRAGDRLRLARALALRPAPAPGRAASAPRLAPMVAACVPVAGTPGEAYLARRGIPVELAAAAGVLFSEDWYGRPAVVFRLVDRDGLLVAANGRFLGDRKPKTQHAGDAALGVFPTAGVGAARRRVLVEAPIDALSLAAVGVPAVALGGTGAPHWLPGACWRTPVALALDADAAGDAGAARLTEQLAPYARDVRRWRPAGAKDWNQLLQEGGREAVVRAVAAGAGADWLPEACARCGRPVEAFDGDGTPRCTRHAGLES
jgi:hypothetical protein